MSRTVRIRFLTALIAAVVLVAGAVVWLGSDQGSPSFHIREDLVDVVAAPGSEDRVQLDVTLYLPESTPAPAVLLPHGFGGDKTSVHDEAAELAERGFVVLAYSARGFGNSTGRIALNDPDYEVADAAELVDYLAEQPEVLLDEDGDPRIGVTGSSYGGALALLLAGTDERIDAIAPVMTYNDLAQALLPNNATDTIDGSTPAPGASAPNGVFKQAWAGTLFSAGQDVPAADTQPGVPPPGDDSESEAVEPGETPGEVEPDFTDTGTDATTAPPGTGPPAPTVPGADSCGRFTDQVCAAYVDVATDGRATEETLALLHRVSPRSVTGNITAPTLLVQGESDTLFGLDQADANARQITEAGAPVSVIWYTGGHDGGAPGPQLRATIADFLESHLMRGEDGQHPTFTYDVQGSFRTNRTPSVRTVEAEAYPGLGTAAVQREDIELAGSAQEILRPPGSTPAAISGIPGLNQTVESTQLSERLVVDPPGQAATFTSPEMSEQVLMTGASTIRLRIAAADGSAPTGEAVLFAKLYDVAPDGTRTLPGNAVAPIRVPSLPADGTPTEVTVTLPGVVHSVESGHRLQLVVGTTDQAYATPDEPAAYQVSLAGGTVLAVPVVSGTTVADGRPIPQLLGIAGTLLVALVVALIAALRRRRKRSADVDPSLVDTPMVIEGLTKSYPGGIVAVRDLSFRVEPGSVLGLLGPNGAGKTTTLRMLMGLITPTAGEIRVFGHRVSQGAPVLSRIGSFVEGSGFLPHLSGAANLRLYWAATGRRPDEAYVTEALEIAGLGDAVRRKVRTYSQGMRQRLAIAQAMLGLPDLLVLDEPTNGLDPPQIHQMREVLRRYAATGRTVVVSSHLLAEVEQTCTHVVVMHRGALVTAGEVGDIVAASGAATFRVDRPEAAAEALQAMAGVGEVDVEGELVHADLNGVPRSQAVSALVKAGVLVDQAGPRRRLEDAFLQLVGEGEEGR